MKKNKWAWAIAALVVVAGLVISNILSNQKEPMRRRPGAAGQKSIPIITIQNKDIQLPIEMSGPLYAYDKVDIYAEVSGVLLNASRHFKAGTPFEKSGVLIRIDDRVYKNSVLAKKSSLLNQLTLLLPDLSIDFPQSSQRWETYLKNMDLHKDLEPLPEPTSDKERYYIAARNIYNQYYEIKGMETTLSKYTIRAPFSGVVTQALINPGTLVRVGQKLGEFISTEVYEMEASVGLFDANRLELGQPVILSSEDVQGTFTGHIRRINRVLDATSLTVKVYIHVQDPLLRDGMYMVARAEGKPIPFAVAVSKDLIVEQNNLFAVENSKLVLKQVRVVTERGDSAIVRGLADGTKILGEVWADAREGMELPKPSMQGNGPGKKPPPNSNAGDSKKNPPREKE
jgi:multidrug efflux pump subunit AcrA (membrane-fusion protein)